MKLFVIYIGGTHEKALIELHDMRFVIAEKIEDTYGALRKTWWGIPKTLHIDAWGALEYVDGYQIIISETPSAESTEKLFFINLGGYDPQQFTELHKNVFIVAKDSGEAKAKAKKLIKDWTLPHKDYIYEIDDILAITEIVDTSKWHIHLKPTEKTVPFKFTSDYQPLGKK